MANTKAPATIAARGISFVALTMREVVAKCVITGETFLCDVSASYEPVADTLTMERFSDIVLAAITEPLTVETLAVAVRAAVMDALPDVPEVNVMVRHYVVDGVELEVWA